MHPVVDGLRPDYEANVDFKDLNLYENRSLADTYGVQGHPVLVIVRADGSVSKILYGVSSEEEIRAALNEVVR